MPSVNIKNPQTGEEETIEISEEQLNSFQKINEEVISQDKIRMYIDNLNISPEFKAILDSALNVTVKIGDMVVNIGKKIIEIILYIVKEFPNVVMGTLIGFVIGSLISTIPLIGWLLSSIAIPAGMAIGAATGFAYDIEDKMTKQTINNYLDEMFGAFHDMKMAS